MIPITAIFRNWLILALWATWVLPMPSLASAIEPTGALEIAGAPGRVSLDPGFSLAGRSFTVEAWIWLNTAAGDRPVLAQVGDGNLLHLLVRNNRLHLGFFYDDLSGTMEVPVNEWVHVAYTYSEDTRTQRIYLNGQYDGSRIADASFAENNLPLHIGAYFDFTLNPFDGKLLELRIWDHARSGEEIAEGRFATPPVDASGLEALFTFTGVDGFNIPEATGRLTGNTSHGAVSVLHPVAGPAFLGELFPQQSLPTGSLAVAVDSYSFSVAPAADFADANRELLLDGTGPARVWGTPWLDDFGAIVDSIVVWEAVSPEITFDLSGPAQIDSLTLYLANSGGANGIALPTMVRLTTPAGFLRETTVTPGSDTGALQAVTFEDVNTVTREWTVQLVRGAHDVALAGIAIDGALLQQQIIDFPEIGNRQVTDTVLLTASSNAELPVDFTVLSGPGVIETGNELRFTGPGIVLVAAEQLGNPLWNPAEPVLQAFEVRGGQRVFAPGEGLTAGLELGTLPGRLSLANDLSLAERSFTVEAWIWLHAVGGDQPVLAQFGQENLLHLIVRDGRLHLGFWADDLTGESVLPAGEWLHVAYTFDAVTLEQRVYVNGVNDGSRTAHAPFPENNLPLQIGGGYDEFSRPFNGRILELRIWDHPRPGPVLFAGRFQTPPTDAPGLKALFTFTGSEGTSVPEATGQLLAGTLGGDIVIVEPVIGPEYLLGFAFPVQPVATGSLSPWISNYTTNPAPEPAFADPIGNVLTNGLGPARVWGTAWLETLNPPPAEILVWHNAAPAISFQFSETVRINGLTLYTANSGGAENIARPDAIAITTPGGFEQSFDLGPGTTPTGKLESFQLSGLHLYTDALTVTLQGDSSRIALAEVSFDGDTLAEPLSGNHRLPLPAMRYLGIEPGSPSTPEALFDVRINDAEAQFVFPRAIDDHGVRPVVEWSTDLANWEPLTHAPSIVPGKQIALLQPLPQEGRVFFRLGFTDAPPTVIAPVTVGAMESDGELVYSIPTLPNVIHSPHDLGSLQLLAINDQPVQSFTDPITTSSGGTLRFFPNGNMVYAPNPGLAGGQIAQETFTYTVIDRFGQTVRNTFTLTVTGENDPPSVEPITALHSTGAVPAGILYQYFEGDFSSEAAFDTATPVSSGRVPTFSLEPATAPTGFGLEMSGKLFVPASGPYTFYLIGNNASVLDVDGIRVVDHDPAAPASERSGTIELTAGSHPIRVRYFDVVEPAELVVDYSGPGRPQAVIPATAFTRLADLSLDPLAGATDPDDGDSLHISHIDGQPLAHDSPVHLASGATVELNHNGTLTYRPAPGRTLLHEATDSDSFVFTVTDLGGLSASATARIHLARQNTAPVTNGVLSLETNSQLVDLFPDDAFTDADGDELRITHVNGIPLIGDSVVVLPSTARVSLPRVMDVTLRYDGKFSFMRTLAQDRASDAFTLTVVDAAGASADATVHLEGPIYVGNFIGYSDSRFAPHLAARTVQITNRYPFPITLVTYIEQRETGDFFQSRQHEMLSGQMLELEFEIPEGIEVGDQHFFDLFDLHIDTVDGDPIFYYSNIAGLQFEALYSTATESFFRFGAAISPRWPMRVETARGTTFYRSGIYTVVTNYGDIFELYLLDSLNWRRAANKAVLEPNFEGNIIVTGICRPTLDISRFTIENLNDEPVPFTVGSTNQTFTVGAGQTQTIEVPYEPKIEFRVREASLGLFNTNEESCPVEFDFTVTSLCASTSLAFVEVRNNHPANSYTVRVESVLFPSIRSNPVTIGNQGVEFIQFLTQGQNLGGTEGRVIIILANGTEVMGPSFIFSHDPC